MKQFLRDVFWGDSLDYLVVDTPPGTADEHMAIAQHLRGSASSVGAVVVTTPQELALADVRRELSFCKRAGLPVLGVVENMAGFVCGNCGLQTDVFPAGGKEDARGAASLGPRVLARLPLDPRLRALCDNGETLGEEWPDLPVAAAFAGLVGEVVRAMPVAEEEEDMKA